MLARMLEEAEKQSGDIIELRRYFHSFPELSWEEVQTTSRIKEILEGMGFENIRTGFGGTECGLTAELTGKPEGPCVALRADIDALPLQEENDVPYRSRKDGVMHACGHDAHAAMLLGAARILAGMKDEIPGKVKLIFQPGEEAGFNSGAETMIREGALEGVDAVGGLHIWSNVPSGEVGFRKGAIMASADVWEVEIQGKGGHGSMPHKAVDPTIAAATIITTVQTVVSRELDPQETVVVSLGQIEAGTAPNIIPERAVLKGSIRTTSPAVREALPEKIERIMKGICEALRCRGNLVYTNIYPVTVNDPEITDMAVNMAEEMLGKECVKEADLVMGSEDFSYYEEQVPGTFFFLGSGNPEKGTEEQHHSPRFNVDEDVLYKGAALLAGFAWTYLDRSSGEK
ncbi:MAG: amidohydrolase [Synergistales bacterium]|nr:amidohydrolase [Synergistales bacterium]